MAVDITALYCCLDDFCKVFADWEAHRLIPSAQTRQRAGKLSRSEMLFIMVLFHLAPYKNFKTFYLYGIGCQHRACFGDLPHYDRFVSLMPRLFVPLMLLLHSMSGEPTGVYFADSFRLAVCHNRRIDRHKVFDGLAARGKTAMGWFFGLKLHLVINHKGQVMALKITPGNTADSTVLNAITRHLSGKIYADKGYIGRKLFHRLWQRGLHLITGIRRNMRNYLMPLTDKLMLRKRFVIETVLDILKCDLGLEHSRHRSVINAMVHILSCLVAYAFRPGKPSISLTRQDRGLSIVRVSQAKWYSPYARPLQVALYVEPEEARMETTVEVTLPIDAETAKALNSSARREAAGRYLSGLLTGERVRDVLAESIAEAKPETRASGLMRTSTLSLRFGEASAKLDCCL